MTTKTLPTLSKNDLAILGAIFDPEASLTVDTPLPADQAISSTTNTSVPKHVVVAERAILNPLNTPAPSPNQLKLAISKLSHLIHENPAYPSLYNNRAQATRLLPDSLTTPSTLYSILSDLQCAISVATTQSHHPTLAKAHVHRAYILLSASQSSSLLTILSSLDPPVPLHNGTETSGSLTPSKLEDLASQDFAAAARYGDQEARKMAVKTNPYAKLCGGIVREALREEIRGFYEGRGMTGCGGVIV